MAFRETCPVEERIALFNVYESGAFTVVELCERYNISRETFYVWKRRRDAGGVRWLTIGEIGTPWTVETARREAQRFYRHLQLAMSRLPRWRACIFPCCMGIVCQLFAT